VPTIRPPEDRDASIRLWVEVPIGASERLPKNPAATYCSCPGAFCEGRASRHWATCDVACRHCNPRRGRSRAVNAREGKHAPAV
jgi:hypothetical protein